MSPHQAESFPEEGALKSEASNPNGNAAAVGMAGPPKITIVWGSVIFMVIAHAGAVYGLLLILTWRVKLLTFAFGVMLYWVNAVGITAGVHRLWTHKAYKAKLPLQALLAVAFTMSFQSTIFLWARNHRVHHKFSETDADPHNSKRGFFFSHVGWVLVRKHPLVVEQGRKIDVSDLEADPLVMYQHRYYVPLGVTLCFILPAVIPWVLWDEDLLSGFFICGVLRYVCAFHATCLVNSVAHMWGMQPYDANVQARQNLFVTLFTAGEGWHNYHHVFPWDYKTDETGGKRANLATKFIEFSHRIGWAYDLKTVPDSVIAQRANRSGDGSWGTLMKKKGE